MEQPNTKPINFAKGVEIAATDRGYVRDSRGALLLVTPKRLATDKLSTVRRRMPLIRQKCHRTRYGVDCAPRGGFAPRRRGKKIDVSIPKPQIGLLMRDTGSGFLPGHHARLKAKAELKNLFLAASSIQANEIAAERRARRAARGGASHA